MASRGPAHDRSVDASPSPTLSITIEELAAAVGVRSVRLERLVVSGVLRPIDPETRRFEVADVPRLRRMLRLRRELALDLHGAAIVVELLERLERLEAELERMHGS